MYALPWKCTDNPQCFLEITRKCRVACPSCYQRGGFLTGQHKPLSLIREEIDIFIDALNPGAICIVGGEPTEHPELPKVVRFIRERGVTAALFTSTFDLDEQSIAELVDSGLCAIYAHIDRQTGQHKKRGATELDMMVYRDRIAGLLRRHKGRLYGLVSSIIGDENIDDVCRIQQWAHQNYDIIKYCVFTLDGHKSGGGVRREVADLVGRLREYWPDFRVNSCLLGTETDIIHWGQAVTWVGKGKARYLEAGTVEVLDRLHRHLFRRYVSILPPWIFRILPGLFTTVIVRPHARGTVDFCAACPDQTIIWVKKGRKRVPVLVHSCLSQDFSQKGYSEEEHNLHELVNRGGARKELAFCTYQGNSYSRDLTVISDWDEAMAYEKRL